MVHLVGPKISRLTPLAKVVDLWERQDLNGAVLRSLDGHFAVVNSRGVIIAVNAAWERFAKDNVDIAPHHVGVGSNYLEVCWRSSAAGDETAAQALAGMQAILQRERDNFSLEYACDWVTEQRWFRIDIVPLERMRGGAVISHTDITEHKRAQLELQQNRNELAHVRRASTIGELAASLAHELNQPLTAILSNVQAAQRLLKAPLPDLNEIQQILSDIVSDNKRASEVIQRTRVFLKKTNSERKLLQINEIVHDVSKLLQSDALIRGISIDLDLTPDLPDIKADVIQLQQVLLNIMLNGFDAMQKTVPNQRVLRITTRQIRPKAVQVSVVDAGCGLKPTHLERIFEPFFTTKAEGLGLGLMIARSIVQAHQGRLWAEANHPRGTVFHFSLPIDAQAA